MQHLREHPDVQNIDLMILAGFCRNCLSRWYREAAEDRVGVLHEQLAGRREADAAGRAVDQAGPGLGLECGDLARDRGLGERERLGGG